MSTLDHPPPEPLRVFISYSHDSPEHCNHVLALAQQLRQDGVGAELDQFHQQELMHWPRWCEEQLRPDHSDSWQLVDLAQATETMRKAMDHATTVSDRDECLELLERILQSLANSPHPEGWWSGVARSCEWTQPFLSTVDAFTANRLDSGKGSDPQALAFAIDWAEEIADAALRARLGS